MKQFVTLLAVFAVFLSCERLASETDNGLFIAEFVSSGSPDSLDTQKIWSVGDRVVLSNCREDSQDYNEINFNDTRYTRKWDDKAKVPYMVDAILPQD